ncbi:MAG: GTPase Era [Gammaproteobacteria bacterium PRO9]|nr:GTPase Era [Gammaproteobacteria bacterium PRO9]
MPAQADPAAVAEAFRTGFVAVVGRPNVGKSTLVNALVGRKISIVTPRPQTTRHAIVGVLSRPDAQFLFVDTPGLHVRVRNQLNRAMNRAVEGALAGADVAVFVVEAGVFKAADTYVLEHVVAAGIPVVLVVNKVDTVKPKSALLPWLAACAERAAFHAIVPVSATTADNLDRLLEVVAGLLPEGQPLYPPDVSTDRGMEFRIAEVIREKLLMALRQEVPYGLAVEILALEQSPGVALVDAVIWADRESHKGIVVGKGGATIKEVGTAARLELERIFNLRFHLETRVKVKTNWADSARTLQQFGFESGS